MRKSHRFISTRVKELNRFLKAPRRMNCAVRLHHLLDLVAPRVARARCCAQAKSGPRMHALKALPQQVCVGEHLGDGRHGITLITALSARPTERTWLVGRDQHASHGGSVHRGDRIIWGGLLISENHHGRSDAASSHRARLWPGHDCAAHPPVHHVVEFFPVAKWRRHCRLVNASAAAVQPCCTGAEAGARRPASRAHRRRPDARCRC